MWSYFVLDYYDIRITYCMWSYFVLDYYDIRITYCMWSYFVLDYYDIRITYCMWSYFVRDILTSGLGIVCGVTLYLTTLTSGFGIVVEYTTESRRLSFGVGYYTSVGSFPAETSWWHSVRIVNRTSITHLFAFDSHRTYTCVATVRIFRLILAKTAGLTYLHCMSYVKRTGVLISP